MSAKCAAIIGMGATGCATFVNLVRASLYDEYFIFDSHLLEGGLSFNTYNNQLLCNTSNLINSIFLDNPGDFTSYLQQQGMKTSDEEYAPRNLFKSYYLSRFQEYLQIAGRKGYVVHLVNKDTTLIEPLTPSGYSVSCGGNQQYQVNDVFVCRGATTPSIPKQLTPYLQSPNLFLSPFPDNLLVSSIRDGSRVLILGSQLSAIDAAISLTEKQCSLTMISHSGRLPSIRNSTLLQQEYITRNELNYLTENPKLLKSRGFRVILQAIQRKSDLPRRNQVSNCTDPFLLLETELEIAGKRMNHWEYLLVEFVELINEVGSLLPPLDRIKMMDTFKPLIYHYLGSFPPVNGEILLAYKRKGKLSLLKATDKDTLLCRNGKWYLHPTNTSASLSFDYVVNATGFEKPQIYETAEKYCFRQPHAAAIPLIPNKKLRVLKTHTGHAENIWLIGASSNQLYPFSMYFRGAVKQIDFIVNQLRDGSREEDNQNKQI